MAIPTGARVEVIRWPGSRGRVTGGGPTRCVVRLDNGNEVGCTYDELRAVA